MDKIGIIVLNWNNYESTKKCIKIILTSIVDKIFNVELFLIDNNSNDASGEKLAQEFGKKLHFFDTGFNGGYTAGNNFGMSKAMELGCSFLLVLNNDLLVENLPLILNDIDKVFKSNSKIGILGFEIFNQQTKQKLRQEGVSDKIFNKLLNIQNKKIYIDRNVTITETRSVCGCAICFRSACIESIGMFDEQFFMYAEEQDICLRAITSQWKVVKILDGKFKIYRKIDPVSETQLIWYYGTRNIFCAYKKNLKFFNRYVFSSIQLCIYFKQILCFLLSNDYKISLKIIKGLKDALASKKCNGVQGDLR